jgi:hypothetical protein
MSDDRFELPYEDVPGGPFEAALGPEYPLSDHVVVAGAFFEAPGGLFVPCLRIGFQRGVPGRPPEWVTGTAFVGDERTVSSFERLVHDAVSSARRGVARARLDRGRHAN